MIPFDGELAQELYGFALGAYDATQPPAGYTKGATAFEIVAKTDDKNLAEQLKASPIMQSMLAQPRKPQLTQANANSTQLAAAQRGAAPNQHFGWICVDAKKNRLIVSFRGTEFFHDWLDDADFIPAPYGPIPGRGTVHQGFQLVYYSIWDSVVKTVQA